MLKVADIYESYDREKSKKYLLDFDDLLVEAYHLLTDHPEIGTNIRNGTFIFWLTSIRTPIRFSLEILKLLIAANNQSSFWVCGDDWQTIYAFTGASVGNILNFHRMFEESKIFILNLNYRSTPQILKACQNLIQHNVRKIEKTLTTHNEDGDDVIVLEASSEEGEALNLINEITNWLNTGIMNTRI